MATVHMGRLLGEAGFTRTVAIKRLHPQFAKDPDFVSMFLDEARLASRIRHPNVVSTLDVVALDGELFLVMEYVQGESLSRLARVARQKGGRIPPKIALSIMTGVLQGLHAAHDAKSESGDLLGIVHRDVSPQNVLVDADGAARVIDFGVAKAAGRLQTTRDGVLKGKLQYMAPEQIEGAPLDRRADIYAATVVLWELLAGRRLFQAEDDGALLSQIFNSVVKGNIDPPSKYSPTLPKGLDAIVLKGLACKPENRFATAKEMAIALEKAAMIATPREVGEWVEKTAGDQLKLKAERIAEIESIRTIPSMSTMPVVPQFSSQGGPDAAPAPPAVIEPPTLVSDPNMARLSMPSLSSISSVSAPQGMSVSSPIPGAPTTRKTIFIMGAVAAVVMIVGLVAGRFLFARPERQTVIYSSGPAVTSSPPAASSAPGVEAANDGSAPAASASAEPATSASAEPSATSTAKAPVPPWPGGKAKPPVGPGDPGKAKPPAVSCDPPYTIDANGIKHYKPQCLK